MAAKKPQKKKRGRTTAATASVSNTIRSTMFRGVIDMTVTVATSGSVLLCLFAAKRFI
jgi:hypothetical protein